MAGPLEARGPAFARVAIRHAAKCGSGQGFPQRVKIRHRLSNAWLEAKRREAERAKTEPKLKHVGLFHVFPKQSAHGIA
jgi:hypothetical protein